MCACVYVSVCALLSISAYVLVFWLPLIACPKQQARTHSPYLSLSLCSSHSHMRPLLNMRT